jgi:hypothetical protein
MAVCSVEQLGSAPDALANKNERDLAGCAGHDFFALNRYNYNSHYCCANCGGVVTYLSALALGAPMSEPYHAWAATQKAAA